MVKLRRMLSRDLENVLAWRNQESVRKNMYTSHVISPEEHKRWWEVQENNSRTVPLIAEIEEVPVGVVIFTNYCGSGGTATWAFYAAEGAKKGVGRAMEYAALDYAFQDLGLRKLECEVLSFNMAVVNLHRRHGFEVEGVFRKSYERGGELYDIYRLAIFSETWLRHVKPQIDQKSSGSSLVGRSHCETIQITDQIVTDFMAATGDRNPVHTDSDYARKCGFSDRLVHGMLCGSFFSRIFATHLPGAGAIYLEQNLQFIRPVYADTEVTAKVTVVSHIGRRITVDCLATVNNETCVLGQAKLLVAKQEDSA